MKLTEIIFLNDVIQKHKATGAKMHMIMVRTPPLLENDLKILISLPAHALKAANGVASSITINEEL